jgi:hypothetical protein
MAHSEPNQSLRKAATSLYLIAFILALITASTTSVVRPSFPHQTPISKPKLTPPTLDLHPHLPTPNHRLHHRRELPRGNLHSNSHDPNVPLNPPNFRPTPNILPSLHGFPRPFHRHSLPPPLLCDSAMQSRRNASLLQSVRHLLSIATNDVLECCTSSYFICCAGGRRCGHGPADEDLLGSRWWGGC